MNSRRKNMNTINMPELEEKGMLWYCMFLMYAIFYIYGRRLTESDIRKTSAVHHWRLTSSWHHICDAITAVSCVLEFLKIKWTLVSVSRHNGPHTTSAGSNNHDIKLKQPRALSKCKPSQFVDTKVRGPSRVATHRNFCLQGSKEGKKKSVDKKQWIAKWTKSSGLPSDRIAGHPSRVPYPVTGESAWLSVDGANLNRKGPSPRTTHGSQFLGKDVLSHKHIKEEERGLPADVRLAGVQRERLRGLSFLKEPTGYPRARQSLSLFGEPARS